MASWARITCGAIGQLSIAAAQLLYLNVGPAREDKLPGVLVPNGWTRIPMTEVDHHFVVPCVLNGSAFRLIVNTGAPFTTLDRTLLRAIKVYSRTLPLDGGLIGNDSVPQELVHLHTLQVGDYTANDVQMTAMKDLSSALVSERERKQTCPPSGCLGRTRWASMVRSSTWAEARCT